MEQLSPEVVAFLATGTRTGKLGWTAVDGRPLVAPVWFVVEDGTLVCSPPARPRRRAGPLPATRGWSSASTSRSRRSRSSRCRARRRSTGPPDELLRTATAIGRRYMGPDRADEFGRRNGVPGELAVRVHPTRVVADLNVTA